MSRPIYTIRYVGGDGVQLELVEPTEHEGGWRMRHLSTTDGDGVMPQEVGPLQAIRHVPMSEDIEFERWLVGTATGLELESTKLAQDIAARLAAKHEVDSSWAAAHAKVLADTTRLLRVVRKTLAVWREQTRELGEAESKRRRRAGSDTVVPLEGRRQ